MQSVENPYYAIEVAQYVSTNGLLMSYLQTVRADYFCKETKISGGVLWSARLLLCLSHTWFDLP